MPSGWDDYQAQYSSESGKVATEHIGSFVYYTKEYVQWLEGKLSLAEEKEEY